MFLGHREKCHSFVTGKNLLIGSRNNRKQFFFFPFSKNLPEKTILWIRYKPKTVHYLFFSQTFSMVVYFLTNKWICFTVLQQGKRGHMKNVHGLPVANAGWPVCIFLLLVAFVSLPLDLNPIAVIGILTFICIGRAGVRDAPNRFTKIPSW